MVPPVFDIQSSVADGVPRLSVCGELDLATAPVLAERLAGLEPGRGPVVVDLAGVTFIDGSGLRVLLAAQDGLTEPGGRAVELVDVSRPVRRLFELVGIVGRLDPRTSGGNPRTSGGNPRTSGGNPHEIT